MALATNRLRGRVGHALRILAVPLALCAAAAGVTVPTVVDAHAAREELSAAEQRLEHLEDDVRGRASRLAVVDPEALKRSKRALEEAYPLDLSPTLAHAGAREAARRAGVILSTLEVGQAIDLGLSGAHLNVRALDARASGSARLSELVDWVERLQGLGLPTAVLEFHVGRTQTSSALFEFRLRLALLTRASRPQGQADFLDE